MTQRDKSFLVILLSAVAGVGLASFLVYQWFWAPLRAYNATIDKMQDENEVLRREWNEFIKGKKRLDLAKLKSLPNKVDQATAEYVPYLEMTLHDAGLTQLGQVTPQSAVKVKAPASVPEIKEVDHRVINFNVKATGDEAALVSALERLQKTPYEHRVKILTVERADKGYLPTASKKLNIDLTIEVLLVAGNKNAMGLHPGIDPQFYLYNHIAARYGAAPAGWGLWASALAVIQATPQMDHRDYDQIAGRNIFVGAIPIYTPGGKGPLTEAELAALEALKQPPEFVPAYVRLTTVVPSMQEAYLFNRIFGGREAKLMAKPGSGYDLFKITDEKHAFVFFMGKVLAIGNREMYFQVRDQVYTLHIGESLAKAMNNPLSVDDLLDLDIYELYDKEWAKEQTGDGKKKTDTGKKKKGRGN
jgi:hypothetical protein